MDVKVALGLGLILVCIIAAVIWFVNLSKEQKIANVKEWLKWAVSIAEKELGGGVGQLKLRQVYDMAVKEFPWLGTTISFNTFSAWVDEALVWMKDQIENNIMIAGYVGK